MVTIWAESSVYRTRFLAATVELPGRGILIYSHIGGCGPDGIALVGTWPPEQLRISLRSAVARMGGMEEATTDATRIAKLKELATSGQTGGAASYYNHLITVYARVGKLTSRERERVDEFLASLGEAK